MVTMIDRKLSLTLVSAFMDKLQELKYWCTWEGIYSFPREVLAINLCAKKTCRTHVSGRIICFFFDIKATLKLLVSARVTTNEVTESFQTLSELRTRNSFSLFWVNSLLEDWRKWESQPDLDLMDWSYSVDSKEAWLIIIFGSGLTKSTKNTGNVGLDMMSYASFHWERSKDIFCLFS